MERRDSADREAPPPSSRKRKGHEGGGNESDPEGGKRARASVEPPPPKEERPRRERRRFEDADANGKHGDERGKGDKDNSNHGAVNGDSRSGLVPNVSVATVSIFFFSSDEVKNYLRNDCFILFWITY